MEFFRLKYWSRKPFPSPGDLPNPGIEPGSPALQAESLPTELPGKAQCWSLIITAVVQSLCHVWFCTSVNCSTPGFPVIRHLRKIAQTHFHWIGETIRPSHPLLSPSPPAFNLSQHQGLFQGVSSIHQVAKVLELQLQHQSFQWIFRTDFP